MNEATRLFVRQHWDDDVRQLALRGVKDPDVDLPLACRQIQGRQTARRKLPTWASIDGIVYPPHLNMEQCSSEQTARYKATVAARLVNGIPMSSLIDLTGGLGVDFAWMSEAFHQATYVERDAPLFTISSANMQLIGKKADMKNADGIAYFRAIDHVTMVYIDSARRDGHGARTYALSDCTPDVLAIRDLLLQKADYVMLKLSPMLDWRKAVSDLGEAYVREVHIVAISNECKELLLVLSEKGDGMTLFCANDDDVFVIADKGTAYLQQAFPNDGELTASPCLFSSKEQDWFLYEPHAALMKAGCFAALSVQFGISQVAMNSHLFVSNHYVADFPGRKFRIVGISTMNKRELKQLLNGITQANIAVRNFPLSVAELRKRLKIGEGGSHYLFATTLADKSHVLILCRKAD